KRQIKLLPLLENAEYDTAENAEDDILLLPSDFDIADHKAYGLEELACLEYTLHEGQANDAIAMLCTGIIHGMVLNDSHRKHSRGVIMNLHSMKYINAVAKKKNEHASSYHQAHIALLHLKGADDLLDFPLLKKEDMYSKNAAGARGLGDSAVTDSWIWTYGRLRGMNEVEKEEFLQDALWVQWFHTHADTQCWIKEVEILKQEFCCYICACQKMEQVWDTMCQETDLHQSWHALDLKDSVSETYQLKEAASSDVTSGYRVYAAQKASMYQTMWQTMKKAFVECRGGWPDMEEELSAYVSACHSLITVDWQAENGQRNRVSLQTLEEAILNGLEDTDLAEDSENVLTVELEQ
ncbi:hypothetical protein IW262DRAFT_1282131, partial [Armillaria fumosa]